MTQSAGFRGVCVVSLESRHPAVVAELIRRYGGVPMVAPSIRELPIEHNESVLAFAGALFAGQFDMVIFLTGVGTRALARVVETQYPRQDLVAALSKVRVVARGPEGAPRLVES